MKYENRLNPYCINPNKTWDWGEFRTHGWIFLWNSSGEDFRAIVQDEPQQHIFTTDIDKWDDELESFLTEVFSHKHELVDDPLRFLKRISPTWSKDSSDRHRPLTMKDMPRERPMIIDSLEDIPNWEDPDWKHNAVCCVLSGDRAADLDAYLERS